MLTSLRGKLIFIFVVLTVSVVIISSGYARYQQRQFALDRSKERSEVDLQLITSDIHSVLLWVLRDLLVLRDLPTLRELINTDDPSRRLKAFHDVQEEFFALASHHQIFQQIRLLDSRGREIIRVNTNGSNTWLTPPQALQDKSGRYYFKEAVHLSADQVYISPMDLNVEQGKIEQPYVPVIRYATPVFDDQGTKRGVLVLNVFGATFLNLLREQQNQVRHGQKYYLLNKDGYFLFHPDSSKTFGFMFNSRETFFRYEPDLRELLNSEPRGLVIQRSRETGKQTLFAFQRIELISSIAPETYGDSEISLSGNNYWILLTAVDDANLLVGFNEYVQSFLPFTLFLIVVCIGVAILLAWSCSRPVVSLAAAARQIQNGDYGARAKVYTTDDMGKFGHQFNEMASRLQQTIEQLRLSEAKYRQIFENSKDCIFVTDTECTVVDINQAGRELFGFDKDTPLDKLSLTCCQAEGGPVGSMPVLQEDMLRNGYVKDYETTLLRPDGKLLHCTMTASARFDEQGNLLGYEGILRDVTAEKERQKAERAFQKQLQEEIVLAEERERRHIGQVLHEETAQNLALVNLKIHEVETVCRQRAGREQDHDTAKAGTLLAEIRSLVNLMIHQIRTMIFDLYPTILDDQGLVPAMLWYADNFSQRTGITVSVYGVPGDLGLSQSQKIYLFRSYKELLQNAWKHAATEEVVATVKKKDNHVRLTVDDDGRGFDPGQLRSSAKTMEGIGLISIRQWTNAMEGTLSIESEPGKGTRIAIDIPLAAREDAS